MVGQKLVEVVIEEEDGMFYIPDNCWAFEADTKKLVAEKAVTKEKAKNIVLIPKIAGG